MGESKEIPFTWNRLRTFNVVFIYILSLSSSSSFERSLCASELPFRALRFDTGVLGIAAGDIAITRFVLALNDGRLFVTGTLLECLLRPRAEFNGDSSSSVRSTSEVSHFHRIIFNVPSSMMGEGSRRALFGLMSSLLELLMLFVLANKGLVSRLLDEGKNIVRGWFRALTRFTINTVPVITMTRPNKDRPRITNTIVPETTRPKVSRGY
jgi:hypothetical protein